MRKVTSFQFRCATACVARCATVGLLWSRGPAAGDGADARERWCACSWPPGYRRRQRQGLVVVEAMKLQNEIRAPKAGTVERVSCREGQTISAARPRILA